MIVSPPSFEQPKWLVAFVVVLVAHISLVWALANKATQVEQPLTLSAVMVEFAELPQSATKIEPVTIGPPQEIAVNSTAAASEPQPPTPEEPPKIVVEESPKVEKAEIVVKKQTKTKEKPKEKVKVEPKQNPQKVVKKLPEKPSKKQIPNQESVMKESTSNVNSRASSQTASAPPKGDESKNAAPSNSISEDRNLTQNWKAKVMAHLSRNQRYPQFAMDNGLGGTAFTAITIDGQGNVLNVTLKKSTGVSVLDDETLALVKRSSPLPIPPPHLRERASLVLPIPIRFDPQEFKKAHSR
ncbi:hypothetical protein A6B43_04045 [Vespertiliibacter pulmonis]|uniref:Protein TonB n=1 Tax=Vespertiliibacter pulmonis TaxID=1443036 RepID=A0A3N4VZQ4_9PAST|nr:TonB family protein [Vespertiliibacter pulmonis]QLB20752.1 hypothetical protein A6B43_04045 [Vespertiliibacter pulmonis]RPE82637.1 protein TonB [Vespertiliibacter pulmonis]